MIFARCLIAAFIFIFASSQIHGAPKSQNRSAFRVKRYHLKADKTIWDSKTTILYADKDVCISLFLADGTTAYIYADHAQEDRAKGKGRAWGNSRFLWKDLLVRSQEITFDSLEREVKFLNGGTLLYRNKQKGDLDMDFSTLVGQLDSEDFSVTTAWDAKGVWQGGVSKQP